MIGTFRMLAAAGVLAAVSPTGIAGAVTVSLTGTIKVVCTITTDASLAKGSSISVNAQARGSGLNDFQQVTSTVTAKKSANAQTVTVLLPYKWTLPTPQKTVPVYVTIDAGLFPNSASVSTSLSIPLPANGATTTVAIPVRI